MSEFIEMVGEMLVNSGRVVPLSEYPTNQPNY